MPLLLQYFVKLSISLSVVFIFYQLILRRLTFYNWNRFFLVGYSMVAFIIPFVNVSPILETSELRSSKLVEIVPLVQPISTFQRTTGIKDSWSIWVVIIFGGILLLIGRLLLQHLSFIRLRRSALLIVNSPVKLYQVEEPIIPFSFGNAIFINRDKHSEEDMRQIIRHEFVHVRQNHSIDMIIAEWICIVNWYNPFAWLIRNAIRQNLEFIADSKVIEYGVDKKHYQYLLLKVMGVPQYSIATNFNFASLKKRIVMMNKMRSAKVHLIRFLFVLPLAAILLLSFRNREAQHKLAGITRESQNFDTIPTKPAVPTKSNLPANVKSIRAIDNNVVVILKDGTTQNFDLNYPDEKAEFEKRYGKLPKPPAPPKPPVQAAQVQPVQGSKPNVPAVPKPPHPPVHPAIPVPKVSATINTTVDVQASVSTQEVTSPIKVNVVTADVIDIQPEIHKISVSGNEYTVAEIGSHITRDELNRIRQQLLARGISLELSKIEFENNQLKSVEATIAEGLNKSRFTAEDFNKIIIYKSNRNDDGSVFIIRILDGSIRF